MVGRMSRAKRTVRVPTKDASEEDRERWMERKLARDAEHLKRLTDVMMKFDLDKNESLSHDEVQQLLSDPSCQPEIELIQQEDDTVVTQCNANRPPTDEEVELIFRMADVNGDGAICTEELGYALRAWHAYLAEKDFFIETLEKHDKSGNGSLEPDEMKTFLTELNGGVEVTMEEVEWVMEEADYVRDGSISRLEILVCVASWYASAEGVEGDDRLVQGLELGITQGPNSPNASTTTLSAQKKEEKEEEVTPGDPENKSACCTLL